jgi:hypothetical protein
MANTKTYIDTLASAASVADNYIIVVQNPTDSSSVSSMEKATVGQLREPIVDQIAGNAHDDEVISGSYVTGLTQTTEGKVTAKTNSFETKIDDNSSNAPSVTAVKSYVQNVRNIDIKKDINDALDNLAVEKKGGEGKYIKGISQSGGVITPEVEDLERDLSQGSTKAPTALAAKTYVDNKVNALKYGNGDTGTLIQSISQEAGQVSANIINLDSTIADASNGVPTSQAVKDKIGSLAGVVGGSSTLIKNITEKDGIVSGETISLTDTVVNESGYIPTSQAVYNKVEETLITALSELDHEAGQAGYYFDKITQTDGQITTRLKEFDNEINEITDPADKLNVPSTFAVKNYVNKNRNELDTRIDGLTGGNAGTTGTFLRKITQASGAITASEVAFMNSSLATTTTGDLVDYATYSKNSDVAPTVNAVTEQLHRLDRRIDSANAGLTNLTAGPFGAVGSFISEVSQEKGYLQAASTAFLSSVPETVTKADNIAPSAYAVRNAINELKVSEIGSAGSYIRLVSENNGKISATPFEFDSFASGASAASWAGATSENAPSTEAVYNFVNRVKKDILQTSEAMTYEGTVGSYDDIFGKKPYDKGDVYVASNPFNLKGASDVDVKYNVNLGDMLICKESKDSYDADNFDVIGGSEYQIVYGGGSTKKSGPNNIPVFSDERGIVLVDSGESIETIKLREASAASSAEQAKLFASYASSSASFADAKVEPYRQNASSSAEAASIAASQTQVSSNAAVAALTGAQNSSSAAYKAMTGAQNSNAAAATALSGARTSSNAAVTALTGAQESSSAAYTALTGTQESSSAAYAALAGTQESSSAAYSAMTGAKASSNVAKNQAAAASQSAASAASSATSANNSKAIANTAATAATGYMNSALTSLNTTTGYQNSAKSAMTGAQASSIAASQALDGAQNSSKVAASKSDAASTSASYAATYEANAKASASKAASYADDANLEGIKNETTKAASQAACSASLAYTLVASEASRAKAEESRIEAVASAALASEILRATAAEAKKLDMETTKAQTVESALTIQNTVSATSFTATSSRKLKENISPALISALDLIEAVDVVNFNYINDDEKTPHVGFIAEDTDSLLSTPHQNKMDYTNCIGVLLKAVQEITKGMSELKQEIDSLK